jgi:hypothetical protein
MATLVVMMAEELGLPEDVLALPTLGFGEPPPPNPRMVQGADGMWRWRDRTPDLRLVH